MTPDEAVAAHVLARRLLAPAQLEQARARLQALRASGRPADLAGVLAAVLPPHVVAELRAVGEEAFRRETTRFAQRGALPGPGDVVGPYRIRRELGRGAMGVVFDAEHVELERRVALKLRLGPAGEHAALDQRFLLEAQAAARLSHPGIVAVHESGRDAAGRLWIAMAFVEGEPLDAAVRRAGPLAVDDAAAVALGIARALAHAHEQGVLHRDLKPGNVLRRPDGQPLVMDFGLAKLAEGGDALTRTGELLGTPSYMPPEQANGERVDARADVWSLGATLYYLLVGAPPFSGESVVAVLQAVMKAPVPSPRARRPDVPPALEAIVLRCMTRARDERYPTAAAVADDLQRFLARGDTDAAAVARGRRRRRAALVGGVGAALVALAGAVTLAFGRGEPAGPVTTRTERRPDDGGTGAVVTATSRPEPAPPRWRRAEVTARPPGRWSHTMAYDAARRCVVVFGGVTAGGRSLLNDLWSWDGTTWREAKPTPRPPPRYAHAMAYDVPRQRLVVQGGAGGGSRIYSDLWEFDGQGWSQRLGDDFLFTRSGHVGFADPARGRVVFFGGGLGPGSEQVAALFGWNGEAALPVDAGPAPPPPGRRLCGLAWDPGRDVLTIVGAHEGPTGDHWEWHPERGWSQLRALPEERRQPTLVLTDRGLVMIGGCCPAPLDVLLWSGERWRRLEVAGGPSPRQHHAAAWDPERRVVVLFGGEPGDQRTELDETWELSLGD